jgi:hypothetical protein
MTSCHALLFMWSSVLLMDNVRFGIKYRFIQLDRQEAALQTQIPNLIKILFILCWKRNVEMVGQSERYDIFNMLVQRLRSMTHLIINQQSARVTTKGVRLVSG